MEIEETDEQRVQRLKNESNTAATNRISAELKAEKKYKERFNFIMSSYFDLTGLPMSKEEFDIYNWYFNNKAEMGWNIRSWIKNKEKIIEDFKKEHENIPIKSEK